MVLILPSTNALPASDHEDALHLVFLENSFRVGRGVSVCLHICVGLSDISQINFSTWKLNQA